MNRTFLIFLLLLVLFNVILVIIYYQGKYQGKQVFHVVNNQEKEITSIESSKITPSPTKGPTPTSLPRKIPHGKVGFTVSTSTNPNMKRGFIDPYDPKTGEEQTVSIVAQNKDPIGGVSITLITDNQTKVYPMKLVEGSVTDGRWEATWEVKDSYLYTYQIILDAESGSDKSSVTVTLR